MHPENLVENCKIYHQDDAVNNNVIWHVNAEPCKAEVADCKEVKEND